MGVKIYLNTDSGAPVLSGQASSLIALLDAVLVNGYGSKTALGWTKPYSGTNKAVYRLPGTQSGRYLRIDDSNAQYAVASLWNAMTGVDTGTGWVVDWYWRKSATTNSTARAWTIVGDEGFMHFFPKWSDNTTQAPAWYCFGDLVDSPDSPGQVTLINGSSVNNEDVENRNNDAMYMFASDAGTARTMRAIPAANGTFSAQVARLGSHISAGSWLTIPYLNDDANEANGVTFRASPIHVFRSDGERNANNWCMGTLPGLLAPWRRFAYPAHHGIVNSDLVNGEARSFRRQGLQATSQSAGCALVDITGPWR